MTPSSTLNLTVQHQRWLKNEATEQDRESSISCFNTNSSRNLSIVLLGPVSYLLILNVNFSVIFAISDYLRLISDLSETISYRCTNPSCYVAIFRQAAHRIKTLILFYASSSAVDILLRCRYSVMYVQKKESLQHCVSQQEFLVFL